MIDIRCQFCISARSIGHGMMVGCFKNKLKSEGECVYCMWVGLVLHYRRALSLTYNASLFVYYTRLSQPHVPTTGTISISTTGQKAKVNYVCRPM